MPLLPPSDITSRTEYPRPWLGGRWTLRDIIDYNFIATMALLETVADRRETLLRQIHEVNRQTVEEVRKGDVTAISCPSNGSMMSARSRASWRSWSLAASKFNEPMRRSRSRAGGYAAGTFVIPMTQVFARYAKDLLEAQTYPEVRRGGPTTPVGAALRRDRVVARAALRRRAQLRARAARRASAVAD